VIVKVKKLVPHAIIPEYKSDEAAAFDLHLTEDILVVCGKVQFAKTGLAMQILPGHVGRIYVRSSLSVKGLCLANAVGVIDSDYRGEIMLPVITRHWAALNLKAGDRVAQMIVQECHPMEIIEVDELNNTERGTGGFGSTDE